MDGEHGRHRGRRGGDQRIATDSVAVGTGEVWKFVNAGSEDDRRRQQEAVARGVGVVQAPGQPGRQLGPGWLGP